MTAKIKYFQMWRWIVSACEGNYWVPMGMPMPAERVVEEVRQALTIHESIAIMDCQAPTIIPVEKTPLLDGSQNK